MIVSDNKNCPHIINLISLEAIKSIKFSELKCKNCEEKKDLWICLSCGEAFCGRYKNKHFYLHYEQNKDHCIGISTLDLSVWCYNCKTINFKDPGSYIDTEITQKYVDILCNLKFSGNANNNLEILSNDIPPDEANIIKYHNFIELLKNGKIKNGMCLLGPHIYTDKKNINLFNEYNEDIIKEICEKNNIKEIESFNKKMLKEKPELLFIYLSYFNLDIEPNIVHKFIKYLFDKDIIQILFTENIDNCEELSEIPNGKFINVIGNLHHSKCLKCNELVNYEEMTNNIKNGKIMTCDKCGSPIYLDIFKDEDETYIKSYENIIDNNNYDACFIIGTNLNNKIFLSLSSKLSMKSKWIIYINDKKDEKLNLDFGSVFNKQIYLPMEGIGKIIDTLNEVKLAKNIIKPNNICEQFFTYKEDSNGNIISPLLQGFRGYKNINVEFDKYSLFESNKEYFKNDIDYITNLISGIIKTKKCEKQLSILESGSLGSMLGMVIADSMGHRYEFLPVRYDKITLEDMGKGYGGRFQLLPGQWTDDTSMGLCLADSLIVKNGEYDAHDLMHRFLCWWYYGYNNAFRFDNTRSASVGLGGQISQSFYNYIFSPKKLTSAGDKNSSGIGSIMRNAAVPILFHNNIEKGMEIAKLQSLLTHQGEEAAECCRLLTYIVVKILNRKEEKLNDIIGNMEKFETPLNSVKCLSLSKEESDDPDRDWNWKKKDFKYSPTRSKNQPGYIGSYAMDGMAMALHVVYYTSSFKDAIIKVVNLCGDADSVGAIVGQIAGAYYGIENIPPEWIETVSKWDHYEIPLRGYILQKMLN